MKCVVCTAEFEAERETVKYCSSTCRSRKLREISVAEISVASVASVSVAEKPDLSKLDEPCPYMLPPYNEKVCVVCAGDRNKKLATPYFHGLVKSSV